MSMKDSAVGYPDAYSSGVESRVQAAIRTLLLTDLVDSTKLVESLGDQRAAELFARHDRLARDLLPRFKGLEIDKTDGFLLLFERPFDAVGYALAYHRALVELSHELSGPAAEVRLAARAGIHLGEVMLRRNRPDDVARGAKPLEVEGIAKPMAARFMSLAGARQTLLTRSAFDLARRSALDEERWDESLTWLAHGEYLLKGVDDPVEVFEVGIEGFAPLLPPADSEKVKRAVSLSDELVLGWRPAAGQAIPQRPNWLLEERLGEVDFGEVWRAGHESGDKRVFKFCFEASRLRALKREVTLFRLLREALGHRDDIAGVLDWNFDSAPYFLEAEHTGAGNLKAWAKERGSLAAVPLETRLELVAQVADALAAAHSVGVLHKDVEPGKILVTQTGDGRPRAMLTDFGLSTLVDTTHLDAHGLGSKELTDSLAEDLTASGSRRYLAPELLEGKPASVQADLYSLGVLLYQMVAGDFSRALAPGWRREVSDELLAEDIAALVDGSPQRRPASAGPVAERLRGLERRRAERSAGARARRRRRRLRLGAMAGGVALAVLAALLIQATAARREANRLQARAEQARGQAEELVAFMLGDLRKNLQAVGRLDALEGAGQKVLEYYDRVESDGAEAETVARHAQALHQLGDVRMAEGDLDAALELFRRSLEKSQALAARNPGDLDALFELGQSHFWVGNVFFRQRKWRRALAEMETYLELSERLHQRQPANDDWLLEVAYGHNNLGAVYAQLGNTPLAREQYEQALAISRQLLERDPARSDRRLRWIKAQTRLGEALASEGELGAAYRQHGEALAATRSMLQEMPDDATVARQLSAVQGFMASLALGLGKLDDARRLATDQLERLTTLVELEPGQAEWRQLQGLADYLLAQVHFYAGHPELASGHLRSSIATFEAMRQDWDGTRQVDLYLAQGLRQLAETRLSRGQLTEARAAAERAEALGEAYGEGWDWTVRTEVRLVLGRVLDRQDSPEAARRVWSAALEEAEARARGSRDYLALDLWAQVLLHLGRADEARAPIYTLLGMGYRHPRLVNVCRQEAGDLCRA